MEVACTSPLPVSSLVWQARPDRWMLTFVTKATFELRPGASALAASQEPIHEADVFRDDGPVRSLYSASDVAPAKPRADVVLVGSAFAPGGQPVRSLVARLVVGEIDKAIEVHQDRRIGPDGAVIPGKGFTRMPLRHERAAGGPDTSNPVGVRPDARDAYGRVALPNLQAPGVDALAPGAVLAPVGLGPLPESWPVRRAKLGRHAAAFPPGRRPAGPLPDDLDWTFFNAAPQDQQLSELPEGTRVLLENLHPEVPRLITTFPALRMRAVFEGRGGSRAVDIRCDTLWIDTDRAIACLTFRGQLVLERADEAGRIVISCDEPPGSRLGRLAAREEREGAETGAAIVEEDDQLTPGATVPFMRALTALPGVDMPFAAVLPFAGQQPPARDERSGPPSARGGVPFFQPSPRTSAVPAPPPPPPPSAPGTPRPPAQGWGAPAPAPPPPPPLSPPQPASVPVPAAPPVPVAQSIGQLAAAAAAAAPAGPSQDAGASNVAVAPAAGGELAPSSKGPAPSDRARRPSQLDGREMLRLVWYSPASVPRICRVPEWRRILDEKEAHPSDDDLDEQAPEKDPIEVEDTRDVFEILARGEAEDVDRLGEALAAAVHSGGRFVPPLLLVAGELAFPFDERETLRATLAVATPLGAADEGLRSTMREARELLAVEPSLPRVTAESYTNRIREAIQRARKPGAPDTFDAQVERALLEGRHYQRRQVLGMNAIRALLYPGTAPASASASVSARPVPAYLPDDIARRLPLFQKLRARLIVELHLQEDQYEGHAAALEVLAIGRVQAR